MSNIGIGPGALPRIAATSRCLGWGRGAGPNLVRGERCAFIGPNTRAPAEECSGYINLFNAIVLTDRSRFFSFLLKLLFVAARIRIEVGRLWRDRGFLAAMFWWALLIAFFMGAVFDAKVRGL